MQTKDKHFWASVFFLGFSCSMVQVILAREFMNVFGGNELMFGFVMAGWLVGVALGALIVPRRGRSWSMAMTALVGVALPFVFFGIEVLRKLLGASPGQIIDVVPAGLATFITILPLSVTYGAIFQGLVRWARDEGRGDSSAGRIYAIEALGFIVGGISLTALLCFSVSALLIIVCLLMAHLVLAAIVLGWRPVAWGIMGLGILGIVTGVPQRIEVSLVKSQWHGFSVLASEDSIYGRVTAVERDGQVSIFENGLLSYTVPDELVSEESVHYALLAQADPQKVLLIGGGPEAILQALKYKGLTVDYVEMDPLAIDLARRFISVAPSVFDDPRVRVVVGDPRRFVKTSAASYNAVVVNVSDPVSLLANRYYTEGFFVEVARTLGPGGILSISLSSSENYLNNEARALIRSVYMTLRSVFPDVQFVPGDKVIFMASTSKGGVVLDVATLAERLKSRGILTHYVQPYYFNERLSAFRVDQFRQMLKVSGKINQDDHPYGLAKGLALWSTHFQGWFARFIVTVEEAWVLPAFFMFLVFAFWLVTRLASGGGGLATAFCAGFVQMTLQVIIIFYFQSLYGFLFSWLGLLTAAFMFGVFSGGWRLVLSVCEPIVELRWVQLAASALSVALAFLVLLGINNGPVFWGQLGFLVVAFLVGLLGGRQFLLVTRCVGRSGSIYALDVLGASLGVLLGGIVLMAVIGVVGTLLTCAVLSFAIWALAVFYPGKWSDGV